MNKLFLLLIFFCFSLFAGAQHKFTGVPVDANKTVSLSSRFKDYSLFRISTVEIKQFAENQKGGDIRFTLSLPGKAEWNFSIQEKDILAKNYSLTVSNVTGKSVLPKPACMTYTGNVQNDAQSRVSLTITEDIIYGIIRSGGKEYFIEPLAYLNNTLPSDIYAVYETKDVILNPSLKCGVTEMKEREQNIGSSQNRTAAGLACVQVQLAIASDVSMFTRYGTVNAVQTHNIGVINNVIWDYVNAQFNNNIEFVIVNQNVSTVAANDQLTPAYSGTTSATVLANFKAWGQAGNFGAGVIYDLAEFWTTRSYDGGSGTVGLAYLGAVCTTSKYHILSDFPGSNPSGSGFQLRVMTSHEIGHNFNCSHDAAGSIYIMAPTVQNTVTWSPASITSVDGFIPSAACLAQCSTAGAPLANFLTTSAATCVGTPIQFKDQSLHGPTSWNWTFSGGTPSTSTLRNPTVTFATAGFKNVSLVATNGAGSNTFSTNILVSASAATACTNAGTGTTNAGVLSFNLGGINKITGGVAADGNKYLDFSCTDITKLLANTTYNADVSVGTTNPSNTFNGIVFFIDYNNDGDFLDAGETVYDSGGAGFIGARSFTFTTPASPIVKNQFLRARIIAKDFGGSSSSCSNNSAGQVEDYAVYFEDLSVLDVTLLNFTGNYSSGKNFLVWNTTNEINNNRFEIERSFTGTSDFEKIGTIPAGALAVGNYTYTDDISKLPNNRFYYRLKIFSNNGEYSYSKVILLQIKGNIDIITLFPNPVKKGTALSAEVKNVKVLSYAVFNSIGQVIYKSPAGVSETEIKFNVPATFPSGQYLIKFNTGDGTVVKKFIVY